MIYVRPPINLYLINQCLPTRRSNTIQLRHSHYVACIVFLHTITNICRSYQHLNQTTSYCNNWLSATQLDQLNYEVDIKPDLVPLPVVVDALQGDELGLRAEVRQDVLRGDIIIDITWYL